MPLLRKQRYVQKGDNLIQITTFCDNYDYLYDTECDFTLLHLEVCVSTPMFPTDLGSEGHLFSVREFGYRCFDPRTYAGYSNFYAHGVQHCNTSPDHILGVINGRVDVRDPYAVDALLKRVIRRYRPTLTDYYDKAVYFREDVLCP